MFGIVCMFVFFETIHLRRQTGAYRALALISNIFIYQRYTHTHTTGRYTVKDSAHLRIIMPHRRHFSTVCVCVCEVRICVLSGA